MVSLIAYDKRIATKSVVTERILYVSKKYQKTLYETDNFPTF